MTVTSSINQRWQFYRLLNSQAENLLTDTRQGVITLQQAVNSLKAMRLDFAQQIPRGSSLQQSDNAPANESPAPKAPDSDTPPPERALSAAAASQAATGNQAATGTGSNASSSVTGS